MATNRPWYCNDRWALCWKHRRARCQEWQASGHAQYARQRYELIRATGHWLRPSTCRWPSTIRTTPPPSTTRNAIASATASRHQTPTLRSTTLHPLPRWTLPISLAKGLNRSDGPFGRASANGAALCGPLGAAVAGGDRGGAEWLPQGGRSHDRNTEVQLAVATWKRLQETMVTAAVAKLQDRCV